MFETLPVKRGRKADRPERRTRTSAILTSLREAMILGGLVLACLFPTSVADAVLIAGPDGSINTTAPSPDPGFDNVGIVNGLTGVYVRNGWVLTANHVGIGDLTLGGVAGTTYEAVPGSVVRFDTPGFDQDADLIAFKLRERPPIADLSLAPGPVAFGNDVIMIGNGQSRGDATTWNGFEGWEHFSPPSIRWGTNEVSIVNQPVENLMAADTRAFVTVFTDLNGARRNDPEAQAVVGDSGGAVFLSNGGMELVGILFARGSINGAQEGQPPNTALYDNASFIVDLDFYRSQILAVIDEPDCDDGLDEDDDGLIDYPADPGCSSAFDFDEQSESLICDNGIDDDVDGLFDFPEDDGCDDSLDTSEVPEPGFSAALFTGASGLALAGRRRRAAGRSSRSARRGSRSA